MMRRTSCNVIPGTSTRTDSNRSREGCQITNPGSWNCVHSRPNDKMKHLLHRIILDHNFYDQELMTDSSLDVRRSCGLGESRDHGAVIYVGILEINGTHKSTNYNRPCQVRARTEPRRPEWTPNRPSQRFLGAARACAVSDNDQDFVSPEVKGTLPH